MLNCRQLSVTILKSETDGSVEKTGPASTVSEKPKKKHMAKCNSFQNQNSETKTWTLMMFWPESPWCERLRMDSFRTVDSGPIRGFIWRATPGGNKNRWKYQETSIGLTTMDRLPKKDAWIWLLNVQDFPFSSPLLHQSRLFWWQMEFSDF